MSLDGSLNSVSIIEICIDGQEIFEGIRTMILFLFFSRGRLFDKKK